MSITWGTSEMERGLFWPSVRSRIGTYREVVMGRGGFCCLVPLLSLWFLLLPDKKAGASQGCLCSNHIGKRVSLLLLKIAWW